MRALFAESPITEVEEQSISRLELPLTQPPAVPTGAAPPPEGAVVLMDMELLLLAAGPPSATKTAALRLLERAANRQIHAAVDSHTLLELLRLLPALQGGELYKELRRLPIEFWPIDAATVDRLQSLRVSHPGLGISAALSAAVCLEHDAGLCSYNAELRSDGGITRYEP